MGEPRKLDVGNGLYVTSPVLDALQAERDQLAAEVTRLRAALAEESGHVERLAAANKAAAAELAECEHLRTLGGRPPEVDTSWGNVTLAPPASATDDTAPALYRGRRGGREQ